MNVSNIGLSRIEGARSDPDDYVSIESGMYNIIISCICNVLRWPFWKMDSVCFILKNPFDVVVGVA